MLNIYDVIEMIKLGEGWGVDFKEKLTKPASLAAALVAFANHQGGTILIGVNDKGQITGFKATKEDRDNILRAGRDGCRPAITNLDISEFVVDDKTITVISVPEGLSEVYTTSDGKYLIREGSENVSIEWRKLQQLMVERKKIIFEEHPCEGAVYEDIDLNKVRQYIKARTEKFRTQIDIPPEDMLKSRKCLIELSGKLLPTHAGILLFGKDPQRLLPMSYVTVVKFKGKDQGQGYEDRKDFNGTLVELIEKTLGWIDERMYHGGKIPKQSIIREEIMQFHIPSLREILVNAVAHREFHNSGSRIIVSMFDDRLEVQSPGKLPAHITPKNILREQYARNPSILLTLMEWGLSEGIGQGLDRVFGDLKRNHYRKPKLLDTGASFIFTMIAKDVKKSLDSPKPIIELALNSRQERALAFLKIHKTITVADYLKLNPGVTPRTAHRDLLAMLTQKIIKAKGIKKGRHYTLSDIQNV